MDAIDRGAITPKTAEQMNMTHKALRWPIELWMRFTQMKLKYKGDIGTIPKEAPAAVRQLLGMPALPPEAPRR